MDVLKGNFQPRKPVDASAATNSLEDRFEREALKRLGGSIAFVSRKRLLWSGDGATPDVATPESAAEKKE